MKGSLIVILVFIFCAWSCSPSARIARYATKDVISDPALQTAHVGISIWDVSSKSYLYNYQGDKYFVPASNTKLPGCYAAMKYLGDSLLAYKYQWIGDDLYLQAAGDPSFFNTEFPRNLSADLLKNVSGRIIVDLSTWQDRPWGSGWSWNDYGESYMAERSGLPIYGNLARFSGSLSGVVAYPVFFGKHFSFDSSHDGAALISGASRAIGANRFFLTDGKSGRGAEIPFITADSVIANLLSDTLKKRVIVRDFLSQRIDPVNSKYSVPTDSLLAPMMHRSDNFYAEQSLLMVSYRLLGIMNDAKIIDTLLKTDLADLPQKPRWVDGSGLSRYNFFTPQDFVSILIKMKESFGMERVERILPAGNEGTLNNYYKAAGNSLHAKTGTLSGVVAISGFLKTMKGRTLIFSVLVNNHQASATSVRRAVERYLEKIRQTL